MQNANPVSWKPRGEERCAVHSAATRHVMFAFCILHFAFVGCAKAPPVAPAPSPAAAVDPLEQLVRDVDSLLDRPGHRHGTWAVVVQSLAGYERLYERNARTLMVPASAMKIVTVAAAAEAVGWDYRFETRLLATGPIVDGVLRGDLLIVGSGDPSVMGPPSRGDEGLGFGEAGAGGNETAPPWVDALRARGVTRIDGRVIGDDDDVGEPKPGFAWSWEDMGYGYGALPGALNIAENALVITLTPGTAAGLPTIVEVNPPAPGMPVVNHSTTVAADAPRAVWPELRPGEALLSIHGTIPAGSSPVSIVAAVGNPTLWFARVVRNDLLNAGIDVTGDAVDADDLVIGPDRAAATLVHTHESVPLSEVAKPLLKESINLYAEGVLWLATGRDGPRNTDAALDAVRLRLESWGIPREGIQIVDGSGLSRRDVVAPETLVAVLRRFHDGAGTSPWMQAFPIAGRDGSLENRMKRTPAEGNAIAKTGSMSNIRALAGYVKTADGEPLAFAIVANNFEGPGPGVTATIDAIVTRLAAFRRMKNQ
jgi:D-alanyl-D-alanine carboxypeptidase/D-alanyl-D-alanine-endopeptidase (penicillin-binding protein 4)